MKSGGPASDRARSRARVETGVGIVVCLLVLALLAVGRGKTAAQTHAPSTVPGNVSLRIATWNLRDCSARDPVTKTELLLHQDIARFLSQTRPDIAVFEEIQVDSARGGDIAKLSEALAAAGWEMPYTAVVDTKGEDDIALFSRFEILSSGPVLQPSGNDPWPRAGLQAQVSVSGLPMHVFGFHFKAMGDSASEKAREAQARALQAHLTAKFGTGLHTENVVLAGDFNTANASDFWEKGSTLSILSMKDDEDPHNDFISSNYSYKQNSPTFSDSRYSSLLDHIFLSPSLSRGFGSGQVFVLSPGRRQDGIPVSDHAMVVVDLALSVN